MRRSAEEIKGAILLISNMVNDIDDELTEVGLFSLGEEERIDKIESLMDANAHYESVLLTLLWSYGKITDEELLFGKLPKRLV